MDRGKVLHVDASALSDEAVTMLKALASEVRLRILQLLGSESRSVNQLAEYLGIPPSTAAMHIKILEEAGLIHTEFQSASRGMQKLCSRTADQVLVRLPPLEPVVSQAVEISLPIGTYVRAEVQSPCGLATEERFIGMIDDPLSFLEPERFQAQILWFRQGFVEYQTPYRLPPGTLPQSLQLRMEICSEAPTHNEDWPSDITVWVNGVEIGTWTSPSDYGGTRGALTPAWWLDVDSQHGVLKRWEVNGLGTFVDGVQVSDVTCSSLGLTKQRLITLRIGVKDTARHVGGLNLFGSKFGNYPEDLRLRITY
jgi:predicted transcriptional regulator